MSKVVVYGIPNCNSVKKAIDWLNNHKVDFVFHNYKKEGVEIQKLKAWIAQVGWETIFNKKGTTWKSIADQYKNLNEKIAIEIMLTHNSIIKRPIIESGKKLIVGFDEEAYIIAGLSPAV